MTQQIYEQSGPWEQNMAMEFPSPNRLRGAACYLAGPMTDCADLGIGWRESIIPELKSMGVVVLDPTNKPIDIGCEDAAARERFTAMREAGDLAGVRQFMKIIRRVDLRCVDLSSFLIVRLDGTPTMGTFEEIAMGIREQKPVLIWLDGAYNLGNVNAWLLSQVPLEHVFESRQSLLSYIRNIDESVEHPEDRRWMLFNFADLYREVLQ
jgi:hypothetical protein